MLRRVSVRRLAMPAVGRRRMRRRRAVRRQRPAYREWLSRAWFWARRLLWSPWAWAGAMLFALGAGRHGWAIGTGLAALGTYVTAPRERSPAYGLEHGLAVDSADFINSLGGLTGAPYVAGNRVAILNNGDAFYPAMLDAIAAARASITIEAYIYWQGDIGRRVAAALAERARAGVSVKVLLDAVGSSRIGTEILDQLEAAPCQVGWFNPLRWWSLHRYNNRTHRKSLIVDGRVAFTGGAGIADHWLGDAEGPGHWRDLMVRIEGAAVVPLQTGFVQNWLQTTGELVNGPAFFPALDEPGTVAAQMILSSPMTGASAARLTYFYALACASRSILVANPYFVPDRVALALLADAARRGVHVRVVVSGIHNDSRLARYNGTRLFGRLLDAGVEIYEFNRTMLHHKTMVVDGRWATVGTTNFDNRSFAHNEESNLCFFDAALVGELEAAMERDLAESEPVTRASWARRGLLVRSQEVVASLLEQQV